MNYTAQQIADITGSELIGNGKLIVKNLAFDSRTIYAANQTAFLAIQTERNSGEKYISEALEKGVKVIISKNKTTDNQNVTWIIVNDAVTFLQKFAKLHLSSFDQLKTIGITGSNGKTIVKEWLYQSLICDFAVVKSPKSFNSQIGLPISVLKAEENDEIGIFEVGISKPGEMEILEQILQPKIGILTNIGEAHSANYNGKEELINEKIKLFAHSETIIFNGDNEQVYNKITEIYSGKNLISFGFSETNDIFPLNWKNQDFPVKVSCFGNTFEFAAKARDEATISNAFCVISVLNYFNFSTEKIIQKLDELKSVEMRLESVHGVRNNLIINDSYNLDIDSLKIAFQFINEYQKKNKVLVLTDFIDLKNPSQAYKEIATLINANNFNEIYLVGKEITQYSELLNAKTFSFNTTEELIKSQELKNIHNSIILVKGARIFSAEKITNELQLQKHDTVLEVNLNKLLENINLHKAYLKPTTKMMAMVKAFAYGTGGFEVAEFLQHHHIDYLGVAYADEGVDLRKNGITVPIMVMNPEQHSYEAIIDYKLEPEIYSFRVLDLFTETLKAKGIQDEYPIHIKLETGMHRLGFKTHELDDLIKTLREKNIKIKSIFSHLSTADIPEEHDYTRFQLENFDKNSSHLIEGLGYQPIRHILNSAGISIFTDYQYDMVRIGIGMYGISADAELQKKLQSVVTFKTVVSQISEVLENESVSYGRRYRPANNTRIATLPVGYADGIPRSIGYGKGKVAIGGKLYPIVGTICMDMLMVDVGCDHVSEGDEVVIFNSNPSLQDFSKYCETIPYEVLSSISRRVKRIYIKD